MASTAFDRAWSLANANRRFSLSMIFLGLLTALPLLFSLTTASITVDLLVSHGTLVAPIADQDAIANSFSRQPNEIGSKWIVYRNSGLLPLAWRSRASYYGPVLANVYRGFGSLQRNYPALFTLLLLFAASVGVYFCVSLLLNWSIAAAAQSTGSQLRFALYQKMMHLGACDLPGPLEVSPRQLFTEKVDTLIAAIEARGNIIARLIAVSGPLFAAALCTHLWIGVSGLLTTVLVWGLLRIFDRKLVSHRQKLHQDRAALSMSRLLETLDRTPLVLGYGLRDGAGDSFEKRLATYERTALARDTNRVQIVPLVAGVCLVGVCLVTAIVGMNVLRQTPQLSLGSAVFLGLTLAVGFWPLLRSTLAIELMKNAQRAARDIFHYLDREQSVIEVSTPKKLATIQQGIKFEGVTIQDRAGLTLVSDLNLSLVPGCHLALLSSDDRLAPAVSCLLPRFRDPCQGRLLVDDTDLRKFSLDSVRKQVALIAQSGLLFTGTVCENITCGDPRFGLPQAAEAARQAQIFNLIQELPNGFDTVIGEYGETLAPWDAFRIGLARAVLRNPSVYVIEEPKAELDPGTGELMEHCLGMLTEGRITVLIPSRLATLRKVDQVALVHESRLADVGTHAELLHRSELYRHLLYLKFNTYRSDL